MSAGTYRIGADLVAVHLGPAGKARIRSSVPFMVGSLIPCMTGHSVPFIDPSRRLCAGQSHLVITKRASKTVLVSALGVHEGSIEVIPKE